MPVDAISVGYATTLAIGGLIGYLKAGSTQSLYTGIGVGSIMGFGAYQTTQDPSNFYLSLGTSLGMAGLMGYRYSETGKFMPAGMIALLSAAMVGRFVLRGFKIL